MAWGKGAGGAWQDGELQREEGQQQGLGAGGLWGLMGSWRGACPEPVTMRAWPDLSFSISFPGLVKAGGYPSALPSSNPLLPAPRGPWELSPLT